MSEKLVIDKSTLEGIGNAIRTKKGTSDLIPVPNLESEVLSIPTGGGKSYLLREDLIAVTASPSLTQISTGCESVELTSANFSAVDDSGNPYIPIAPEGANFVLIEAASGLSFVRDLLGAKGWSRDMYNKLNDILLIGTNLAKTQWTVRTNQSNGLFFNNGSTYVINGHPCPSNVNDFNSFFALKESIFGNYDHDTIAAYNANNTSGGLYINDAGRLVAILIKRSSGTAGPFSIMRVGSSYKIRWFYFDKPPILGFFTEPYEEG